MEKNIGEYLSRKSTEVIAIVACIGLYRFDHNYYSGCRVNQD